MEAWVVVFLVTLSYLFLSLLVGLFSGGRASDTAEGYVAGDRTLGTVVLYFIMGASIFSAFAFLGGPGWAYSRGGAAFYMLSYGTIGLIPWYFLAPRLSTLGRRFGYVTQAQFFSHRYRSRPLSALLAVVSLAGLLPYLTLQMQGAGYVFSVVTEGRIPVWGGAAIAYCVVLIYVFRSGVLGVAWTNTFQGLLMMGLAWGLGIYLPYKLYGGILPMFEALEQKVPEMLAAPGLTDSGSLWTWGGYSSAIAISAMGFSLWPHYFMKIFTARDIRTLKKTIVFYPTFQIFIVPILFIGFAGIIAFPNVQPADTILPHIVTSMNLPALAVGLFCAGALAASMSTGDAILHGAASILVKDFVRVVSPNFMSGSKETTLIRWLVIAIGAVAYYFAVISEWSLVYLLLLGYGAIAQLFPMLIASLTWRRSTPAGALAGLGTGCLITLIWNLYPQLQWQDIHPGIWGIVGNVLVLIIVSLVTRPMDAEHVSQFIEKE